MVNQSSDCITYTADGWRTVAAGLICLAFTVSAFAPVVDSLRHDGVSSFDLLGGWVFIGISLGLGLGLVALAIHLISRASRQRDVMTITTTGLTYTHLASTNRYSWERFGEMIYTPGLRSSGSYRMNVIGENRSVESS